MIQIHLHGHLKYIECSDTDVLGVYVLSLHFASRQDACHNYNWTLEWMTIPFLLLYEAWESIYFLLNIFGFILKMAQISFRKFRVKLIFQKDSAIYNSLRSKVRCTRQHWLSSIEREVLDTAEDKLQIYRSEWITNWIHCSFDSPMQLHFLCSMGQHDRYSSKSNSLNYRHSLWNEMAGHSREISCKICISFQGRVCQFLHVLSCSTWILYNNIVSFSRLDR